jgi:hypothetical protein
LAEGPVLVERPGEGIAQLTLNNPPLNLVTLEMTEQLIEALEELEGDEAVRAIVVTGPGERGLREVRVPIQAHRRGRRGPGLRRGCGQWRRSNAA